jgi:uncharacterized alkaline shock family protein YloU
VEEIKKGGIIVSKKNNSVKTDCGQIKVSESTIKSLVGITAREVVGVRSLRTTFFDNILKLINKNNFGAGVKVRSEKDGYKIELFVVSAGRESDAELANIIQEDVRYVLKDKLGLEVKKVNINTAGSKYVSEKPIEKSGIGNLRSETEIDLSSIRPLDKTYDSETELVAEAVKKVEGVVGIKSGFLTSLLAKLGLTNFNSGVNINRLDDEVEVELDLVIQARTEVYRVAKVVQKLVAEVLTKEAGLQVNSVQVNIAGVHYELAEKSRQRTLFR